MRSLARLLFLALTWLVLPTATTAAEETITIGNETVSIPLPTGYVRFDGVSRNFDETIEKMMPATQRQLLTLTTTDTRNKARAGQAFDLDRYYGAQSSRKLDSRELTTDDFRTIVGPTKVQLNQDNKALAELGASANKHFRSADLPMDWQIGDMKSLGVFAETDRSIDFGIIAKTQMNGSSAESVVSAGSMLLVRGKLLYLNVNANYRGAEDVAWARSALKTWREAILAANPDGALASILAKFNRPAVWQKILIGGGLILLISLVVTRKKNTASQPSDY